jgi:signal transduction histidine kinase
VVAQRVELLAHGLRNPSTVIHANLEFALRALGPDSREVCAALRDAMDACRKSSGCVDDMLTIFESEQVGLALDIRRFDLAELVEEMVRASTWEACTRRVQSSHEVATGLYVEADRELLRRALENLIQNSLTNTLPGGRVHIDARIEETIEICVSNTGLLIPRVLRPHLFDRYLPGRRKQAARRIALGLYLCRCIAEAHRGSISLQQRQGYTTSFVIRLPRRVRAVVKGSGPAPRVTVAAENAATVEKSQEATRK